MYDLATTAQSRPAPAIDRALIDRINGECTKALKKLEKSTKQYPETPSKRTKVLLLTQFAAVTPIFRSIRSQAL